MANSTSYFSQVSSYFNASVSLPLSESQKDVSADKTLNKLLFCFWFSNSRSTRSTLSLVFKVLLKYIPYICPAPSFLLSSVHSCTGKTFTMIGSLFRDPAFQTTNTALIGFYALVVLYFFSSLTSITPTSSNFLLPRWWPTRAFPPPRAFLPPPVRPRRTSIPPSHSHRKAPRKQVASRWLPTLQSSTDPPSVALRNLLRTPAENQGWKHHDYWHMLMVYDVWKHLTCSLKGFLQMMELMTLKVSLLSVFVWIVCNVHFKLVVRFIYKL